MDRRSFLGAAGAGLILCTIDGKTVRVASPRDARLVDEAAARLKRPPSATPTEQRQFGGDSNFHSFHVHGHRWKGRGGAPEDCPAVGPSETVVARWTEDNPGRWLWHCHVFTHQDMGMAGWYLVD